MVYGRGQGLYNTYTSSCADGILNSWLNLEIFDDGKGREIRNKESDPRRNRRRSWGNAESWKLDLRIDCMLERIWQLLIHSSKVQSFPLTPASQSSSILMDADGEPHLSHLLSNHFPSLSLHSSFFSRVPTFLYVWNSTHNKSWWLCFPLSLFLLDAREKPSHLQTESNTSFHPVQSWFSVVW